MQFFFEKDAENVTKWILLAKLVKRKAIDSKITEMYGLFRRRRRRIPPPINHTFGQVLPPWTKWKFKGPPAASQLHIRDVVGFLGQKGSWKTLWGYERLHEPHDRGSEGDQKNKKRRFRLRFRKFAGQTFQILSLKLQ